MIEKAHAWILGILSTIISALTLDAIVFHRGISEKYVLKEDLIREMAKNRQDHQLIDQKLDRILMELGRKVDR